MPLNPGRIEVVDDAMAEVLRKKSAAERLAIGHRLWAFARDMIDQVVRSEHPEWTEAETRREVARRLSHGAV
jgi:hypothetical protein